MELRKISGLGEYHGAIYGSPGDGTGVSSHTNLTAFSSTAAILAFQNEAPAGSRVFSYPKYARFIIIGVDTGATAMDYYCTVDSKLRYSGGGYQPIPPEFGPVNPAFMNKLPYAGFSGNDPYTRIQVGALTLNAGGTNRNHIHRGHVKQVSAAPLWKLGDEILFTWGDVSRGPLTTFGDSPSAAGVFVRPHGPVALPPQCSYTMQPRFPGISAAFKFEFEIGWMEGRPEDIVGAPAVAVNN